MDDEEIYQGRVEPTLSRLRRQLANKRRKESLGEGFKNLSDVDEKRIQEALESYINRNDGGIAKKTRSF